MHLFTSLIFIVVGAVTLVATVPVSDPPEIVTMPSDEVSKDFRPTEYQVDHEEENTDNNDSYFTSPEPDQQKPNNHKHEHHHIHYHRHCKHRPNQDLPGIDEDDVEVIISEKDLDNWFLNLILKLQRLKVMDIE